VIDLNGGPGVGRVTKPGLPVRVGEPAINPVPRDQIRRACLEALGRIGQTGHYQLLIEVPEGERLARKTMNPRLGVVGGISILGTRGTVLPFSSASYKGTIESELDVATAAGCHAVGLATGGRSERFLRSRVPGLSTDCLVLTADYFAFSLQQAAARGFASIHLACFFGKLVKMAQGHAYTHARTADLNFDQLAGWCADCGLADGTVRRIASANTARESLELIRQDTCLNRILEAVADRALAAARRFAGDGPAIGLHLFDFDGGLLWEAQTAGRHE
jgi:cobalt-precorrin-5B (C1)-methyltransferase